MNSKRRIGLLTGMAGAVLTLGSWVLAPSADAAVQNWTDHDHQNITDCPTGTQFDGQPTTGSGSTALFTWEVSADTSVTITAIDPSVSGLTAYLKGGDAYRVYSPVLSGQPMTSPSNNGGNVPTLSHWFLCYSVTDPTTTTAAPTTVEVTTTTAVDVTTTTLVDVTTTTVLDVTTTTVLEATTTTAVDEVTTTTVDAGGPTTTLVDNVTTTTSVDSGGPTTTVAEESGGPTTTAAQESGGPTTTAAATLPHTGAGSDLLLVLGTLMLLGGTALTLGARTPNRN